jgi:hypothetical protein
LTGNAGSYPFLVGLSVVNGWNGKVVNAGADFQLYPSPETAYLKAMYVIEADDGTRLFVDDDAIRTGSPETLARLVNGDTVDPSLIYFRFTPRITAAVEGASAG